MTSDRAPRCPDLGEFQWQAWFAESRTLFYNRTAWLQPGSGAKAEESKFLPIPSSALNPAEGCDPPLLIHANQMLPICRSDWRATPLTSGGTPRAKIRAQTLIHLSIFFFLFFFKNVMTTDFHPAPSLISQGRLSLISIQAKEACFL